MSNCIACVTFDDCVDGCKSNPMTTEIDRGYVTTGQLASAFVAAHDTSLISSNPEAWGRDRAINNARAIDAGVEAVRARLQSTPNRNPNESLPDVLSKEIAGWLDQWMDEYALTFTRHDCKTLVDHLTDKMAEFIWDRES